MLLIFVKPKGGYQGGLSAADMLLDDVRFVSK